MAGSRSKGPTDPKAELDDPEKLIRAANANARKRKAAEAADGPPKEKKAKATPTKKRKKAKASGRKKKSKKGKKVQGNEANDTVTNQQPGNATPASAEQQQDVPPPPPAPPLPSPRLLSATPEPDFSSLFGESPAPTRSQTPESGKKTGEESHHSTPPPPYAPVDPRLTYAGKTVPGDSGKHLPGQRRTMAAKQPRQNLLTTVENSAQDAPAQTEANSAEDTSAGSGLTEELERALNARSTPSANNQGSAAATTSPGPNDVVQTTETATDVVSVQSTSPTTSTSSFGTGLLLTDEQRSNPGMAWREGLLRWRQSLETAAARPGRLLALAHPLPMNHAWLIDDQVTRAIASVAEATRLRGAPVLAMIGTTAMHRLAQFPNRTLSSFTLQEQTTWGSNDFFGPGQPWILPINHFGNHWYLAHVRLGPPGVVNVDVYDSATNGERQRLTTVRRWIRNSGWFADGQPPWRDIHVNVQPSVQQDGGFECGRFTILNAWTLMLGMTPTNNRPPNQRIWPIVDEMINLAIQGFMDAATIEAMLLHLGIATGQMNNRFAFNRTAPFRTITSLDNDLVTRSQGGVPVSNGLIRRHATRQQGLDPARATPEEARQAHEQLVDNVEASLQDRDPLDRSTPEVDGDIVVLLSHALQKSPDKLPKSPEERIDLFRKVRSEIRAKAQEEHPPPPPEPIGHKSESDSTLPSLTDEQREEILTDLINDIDVLSTAAAILDEEPPEGDELLTVISNLTGRTREELALLTSDDLEDIFETAADKRKDLLSSSPDVSLPEGDSDWSFGSVLQGTPDPLSDMSMHAGGLWEPGDPLPPDESLSSYSPLCNGGTAN